MKFDFTEEQQALHDSARRYIEKDYPFAQRAQRIRQCGGFSRETWQAFADMGWLAASIGEAYSGLGFSAIETAIIAEQIGRGLVLEPYTLCGVLPIAVVQQCAAESQKAALLTAIGAGETLVAVAHSERESRGRVCHVAATATRQAGGYRLNGHKTVVVGAPVADRLIIVARSSGEADDFAGVSLFLVDRGTAGLNLDSVRLLDGTPAADIVMDNIVVGADSLLGTEGGACAGLQRAIDESIVSLSAETVGAMEDVIQLCAEYLKTRKQFGVAIGSFQALQHRLADMAIELSQARASLHRGLATLVDPQIKDSSLVISGVKSQITRSARFVTAQGIQLHGGYGLTEEYRVGHYYRRLLLVDTWFGNMEYHLNRYASLIQRKEVL